MPQRRYQVCTPYPCACLLYVHAVMHSAHTIHSHTHAKYTQASSAIEPLSYMLYVLRNTNCTLLIVTTLWNPSCISLPGSTHSPYCAYHHQHSAALLYSASCIIMWLYYRITQEVLLGKSHTYIHTYIHHTYVRTYMHTYIHTYNIPMCLENCYLVAIRIGVSKMAEGDKNVIGLSGWNTRVDGEILKLFC